MRTTILALSALLLAACLDVPASTVPQTPSDRRAVDAAIDALAAARGPYTCPPLERVDVVSRPPAEVEARCYGPAQSCVYTVQRYVGAPASTLIYVRDDADARTRAALVVHEALHAARACWVYTGTGGDHRDRQAIGQTDECPVWSPADPWHCDRELWLDIERAALARWGRPGR